MALTEVTDVRLQGKPRSIGENVADRPEAGSEVHCLEVGGMPSISSNPLEVTDIQLLGLMLEAHFASELLVNAFVAPFEHRKPSALRFGN